MFLQVCVCSWGGSGGAPGQDLEVPLPLVAGLTGYPLSPPPAAGLTRVPSLPSPPDTGELTTLQVVCLLQLCRRTVLI